MCIENKNIKPEYWSVSRKELSRSFRNLADVFDRQGCTGYAAAIRDEANRLCAPEKRCPHCGKELC